MGFGESARLGPVRGDARAAKLAGPGSVEKESSGGAVVRKADRRASLLDAQSFDDRDFLRNFGDRLRSFVAVELCRGEAQRLRKGDHAGAARLAEEEARATPGLATDRYNAACHLARCVAAAEQDVRLPPAERKAAAEKYARRAVELLAEARKAGVATPSMLQTDPDLAPIRARADFQRLATGRQQPAPGTKP